MFALLLLSTAALQAPAAQEPIATPPAEVAKPKREKVICKAESKTGSRVNFRQICHTKAEWDAIHRENRNVIDKAQRERGWRDTD